MTIEVQLTCIIEGPEVQLPALFVTPSAPSTSKRIYDALWQSGKINQVNYPSDVVWMVALSWDIHGPRFFLRIFLMPLMLEK